MSGKMLLPRPRLRLERGRPRRPPGGCQRHPMVQFMERRKAHLDQHSQLRRRPQDAWVAKVRVGTIPTATSSIGASWQYVNPETTRHPSGSKPPREPAHPKKPSKPESQKKSPNKKKPPAKEKKKAPPPPPEEDEDDDDDDDGSEGGSSSSYEEVEYEESEEEDGEFTDDPSVAATPRGTPRAAQTPKAAAKAKQAAKPAAKPKPAAPAKAKAGKSRPADPRRIHNRRRPFIGRPRW